MKKIIRIKKILSQKSILPFQNIKFLFLVLDQTQHPLGDSKNNNIIFKNILIIKMFFFALVELDFNKNYI